MNIRLDRITALEDGAQEALEEARAAFMNLDDALCDLTKDAVALKDHAPFLRSIANARSRLEESSMHTQKAICLKYEKIKRY